MSLGGFAYLVAFTILVSASVIRAFGDVLRIVLGVSLGIEIFAGVLIDSPIAFLGISGNLDEFGPLQGIGARD